MTRRTAAAAPRPASGSHSTTARAPRPGPQPPQRRRRLRSPFGLPPSAPTQLPAPSSTEPFPLPPWTSDSPLIRVQENRGAQYDLDAPIQRYVPTFPEKAYPTTTRQLGGHLAGIRHYEGDENFIRDPYATVEDALTIFQNDPLLHAPGSAFSYTSYGYDLLSAVVEGASGHECLTYMREVVFRPLGMNDTVADFVTSIIPHRAGFYVRTEDGDVINAPFVDNSYKWAGGGFLSTTEDLLRFGNAHLGDDYLSDTAKRLLFTEQQTHDGDGVG